MRQHICKNCGKIYLTDKQDGTVCPACAAEIKKDVLRVKVCAMCGKEFVGYPRSKYCAACRPIARPWQRPIRCGVMGLCGFSCFGFAAPAVLCGAAR